MHADYYIQEIEKSEFAGENQKEVLQQQALFVSEDGELSDNEKLELEAMIDKKIKGISGSDTNHVLPTAIEQKSRKVFPVYSFDEGYELPDIVQTFNPLNLSYPVWFEEQYLPRFHPLPEPEIQNKIVTCFALLNCRAVLSKKMKIPMPYFLGLRGSGKTEVAMGIAAQYLLGTTTEIRPDTTGAAMRNALDEIGIAREPCLAVFDNFNPSGGYSIDKMGIHYALMLANCEEQSVSRIVGDSDNGKKSTYHTYGYKIITSAFDLRSVAREEAKEILRRTWTVMCKASNPSERRTMFDCQGMKDGYLSVWGDGAKVRSEYGSILAKLARMKSDKYDLPPSAWEILVVPIAVGVFTGVFGSIDEGIESFIDHLAYVDKKSRKHTVSKIDIILTEYVQGELKERAEAALKDDYSALVDQRAYSHIKERDLRSYIQKVTEQSISRQWDDDILFLMSDWGYFLRKIGTEMYFVLD